MATSENNFAFSSDNSDYEYSRHRSQPSDRANSDMFTGRVIGNAAQANRYMKKNICKTGGEIQIPLTIRREQDLKGKYPGRDASTVIEVDKRQFENKKTTNPPKRLVEIVRTGEFMAVKKEPNMQVFEEH
jgi:hypothetical protein